MVWIIDRGREATYLLAAYVVADTGEPVAAHLEERHRRTQEARMTPRKDLGFIAHFPLNAAIKGDDVDWALIPVDLNVGRDLADRLTFLRNANGADAFGDVVEIAEGEAHGNAVTPSAERILPPSATTAGDAADVTMVAYQVTPPARTKYRDLAATPTQVDDVTYLNQHPDEGGTVDPAIVADIGKRYNALPDARRRWVTGVAANIRLNPSTGGVASERRRLLLTSLVDLSADFADDDIVRGISHRYLGDIAHATNVNVADLVGALGIDEAQLFANAVKALINGNASLRYDNDRRCYVEPSKAA